MTDKIAFWLAAFVTAAFFADLFTNSGAASLFLAKKLIDLSYYIAFWR